MGKTIRLNSPNLFLCYRLYDAAATWITAQGKRPTLESMVAFLRTNGCSDFGFDIIVWYLNWNADEINRLLALAQSQDAEFHALNRRNQGPGKKVLIVGEARES